MALLHVLCLLQPRYDFELLVAHLNHGFRGKESERDACFVESVARELGLPFEIETVDVPAYKKSLSLSSQEAAREVRYRFLEEVRRKTNASKIAVGHNADDQAETIMMWLLRGTGLKGLGGMPPVRDGIIRPLIETSRDEIESFLKKRKVSYVVDSSNLKTDYLRNRLRRELFPLLKKEYNPRIIKSLVNTSNILSLENEWIEEYIKPYLEQMVIAEDGKSIVVDIRELLTLPLPLELRCIRNVLKRVKGDLKRIGYAHINAIVEILLSNEPHKELKLPGAIRVEKSYYRLRITSEQTKVITFNYRFNSLPDSVHISEIGRKMCFSLVDGNSCILSTEDPYTAYLDANKVEMPLVIRSFRPGDRFHPFGMKKGEKKVKDFFIGEKVPLMDRRRIPLVFCGNILAWVGGMRTNHRLRVTRKTRKILRIEMN